MVTDKAERDRQPPLCQRSLPDVVQVTSAGIAGWHVGKRADERANRLLRARGYPTDHCAAQVDIDYLTADLVVALARSHVGWLRQFRVDAGRIRMLRSFDPCSGAYVLDIDDPCYGDDNEFKTVFAAIEAALPGLHDRVDQQLAESGHR